MTEIQRSLFALQDEEYRKFNSGLLPTVDPETMIGVRTPALRKLAKQLVREPGAGSFLQELPHSYFEENCLHAFMLESIKDFDECVQALDRFLPYVDNWMTCDLMSPKVLDTHPQELLEKTEEWLASGETYTIRYGVNMLMKHFLRERFCPEYLEMVAKLETQEYYVQMVIAWFFATALTYQYEAAVEYLEKERLERWIHNKSIQKAIESRQIPDERKAYLRMLRRKKQ